MQRADSGRCNGAPMVGGAEECDGWRRSECEMMGGGLEISDGENGWRREDWGEGGL